MAVSDKEGKRAFVDVVIRLLDVNEPPLIRSKCSESSNFIACQHIRENIALENPAGYGNRDFHSGSHLRQYATRDAIVNNSNISIDDKISFNSNSTLLFGGM